MKSSILYGQYNNKYYTLIYLGKHNGKIRGLKSDLIPEGEAKKIAAKAPTVSADALRLWIKDKMPGVYKVAYRTLPVKGFKIVREYNFNA
jgi:hypothetical protein